MRRFWPNAASDPWDEYNDVDFAEAKARVTLKADGTALVETDMTDIGTGTYTIVAQIAGEMLGLRPDQVLPMLLKLPACATCPGLSIGILPKPSRLLS